MSASDVGAPAVDGHTLVGRVRAQAAAPIPAVVLTAYAADEGRRRALAAGFDAHVAKPVGPAALVSVIAGLVAPGRADTQR